MKKLILFVGGFGSGKTECAVNFSIQKAKEGYKTTLVDLDIVNPMFRSSFFQDALFEAGVELIASESAVTAEGLPTVSEKVRNVFFDDSEWVVFDVGGDKIGSVALGQYHKFFENKDLDIEFIFVVSARRPATDDVDRVIKLYDLISYIGRIEITGLLNNTNLGTETEPEHLLEGQEVLLEVSKKIGKPISYVAGTKEIFEALDKNYPDKLIGTRILLKPKPRLPWI